ncbi:hypothetical protein ACD591_09970 [Rufibacter glacialis]|uniref:Uncharacterized protein n=1 Tax=Rufibacter glacialis TaxID=1259555 RepID=A0A5M8Q9V0_9BACT|nr:hypothetical protein [Rufibacter glacialis]KAA6431903.1 hypothetical protein FOE74_17500 [Rufibacter glacialis]GGK80548.1 hypothetical protein GCM10011405_30400 [Rufibacter glacialis]
MDKFEKAKANARLLLILLAVSYALYLIVALDLFMTYEIFVGLAMLLALMASVALFLTIASESGLVGIKSGGKALAASAALAASFALTFAYRNGLLWGTPVLDAAFIDDRSRMDLELYKNGKYLLLSGWMFGEERFSGTYTMEGDRVIFGEYPIAGSDFIPRELLVDKKEKRIYFSKKVDGIYDSSYYYFQIDF